VLNNPSWRNQRVFRVPTTVSSEGFALMAAHFRPTRHDSFAIRMHYLDDTENTGKIYIGYIGKHLENAGSKNI
jgi:hypothetical protein